MRQADFGKYKVEFQGAEFDDEWDAFVSQSPQGTIFSTSAWVRALSEPYRYVLCYKGAELVAGMVALEDGKGQNMLRAPYAFTPYQGLLYRDNSIMHRVQRYSTELEAAKALTRVLTEWYKQVSFSNHWRIHDLRGFTWHTYFDPPENQFRVEVYYTSIVDLRDLVKLEANLKRETLYDIRNARKAGVEVVKEGNLESILGLRELTFSRQGITVQDGETNLLIKLYEAMTMDRRLQSYCAYDPSGRLAATVAVLTYGCQAYYVWAFSDPATRGTEAGSLILWEIFNELHQDGFTDFDMVGVNSPDRGRFKMHFGGRLCHYFALHLQRAVRKEIGDEQAQ